MSNAGRLNRRDFLLSGCSSLAGLAAASHILPNSDATAKDCNATARLPAPTIPEKIDVMALLDEQIRCLKTEQLRYLNEYVCVMSSKWQIRLFEQCGCGGYAPIVFHYCDLLIVDRNHYRFGRSDLDMAFHYDPFRDGMIFESIKFSRQIGPIKFEGSDSIGIAKNPQYDFDPAPFTLTPTRQKPPMTSRHLDETPNDYTIPSEKGEAARADRRLPQRE